MSDPSILHVESRRTLAAAFAVLLNEPGDVSIVWQRRTGRTVFRFPSLERPHPARGFMGASGVRVSQDAVIFDRRSIEDRNKRVHGYLKMLGKLPDNACT